MQKSTAHIFMWRRRAVLDTICFFAKFTMLKKDLDTLYVQVLVFSQVFLFIKFPITWKDCEYIRRYYDVFEYIL